MEMSSNARRFVAALLSFCLAALPSAQAALLGPTAPIRAVGRPAAAPLAVRAWRPGPRTGRALNPQPHNPLGILHGGAFPGCATVGVKPTNLRAPG